jgi:ribulose-phosphate 3-epimerase
MIVNLGFAAQAMIPSAIRKMADCRSFLNEHDLNTPIEVDGNISFESVPEMVAAGADLKGLETRDATDGTRVVGK